MGIHQRLETFLKKCFLLNQEHFPLWHFQRVFGARMNASSVLTEGLNMQSPVRTGEQASLLFNVSSQGYQLLAIADGTLYSRVNVALQPLAFPLPPLLFLNFLLPLSLHIPGMLALMLQPQTFHSTHSGAFICLNTEIALGGPQLSSVKSCPALFSYNFHCRCQIVFDDTWDWLGGLVPKFMVHYHNSAYLKSRIIERML